VSAVAEKRAVSGLVDNEARGKAIRARRLRHGIKSVRQLSIQSGIYREGITAAEEGTASEETYERLEAWFDRFEEETGANERPSEPAAGPRMVKIRGSRAGDVDVVVEGPIEDLEALGAMVERLLTATQRKKDEEAEDGPK